MKWVLFPYISKNLGSERVRHLPKVTQLDSSRARILSLSESTGVHTSRKPHQQDWKQRWEDARPMVLKVWSPELLYQNSKNLCLASPL